MGEGKARIGAAAAWKRATLVGVEEALGPGDGG